MTARGAMFIGVLVWLIAALLGVATGARGEDLAQQFKFQHPPATTVDPYAGWQTFGGGSCCNRTDCRPVPHQQRSDGLWLNIGTIERPLWWKADPTIARQQTPLDERAHACVLSSTPAVPRCWAPPWSGT